MASEPLQEELDLANDKGNQLVDKLTNDYATCLRRVTRLKLDVETGESRLRALDLVVEQFSSELAELNQRKELLELDVCNLQSTLKRLQLEHGEYFQNTIGNSTRRLGKLCATVEFYNHQPAENNLRKLTAQRAELANRVELLRMEHELLAKCKGHWEKMVQRNEMVRRQLPSDHLADILIDQLRQENRRLADALEKQRRSRQER